VEKPSQSTSKPSPEARSAGAGRWKVGVTLILALIAVGLVLGIPWRSGPAPPAIPTAGLEPAVARLIEQSLADTRASPRSATAWGKLGSVLMHGEFIEPSGEAFEEAERLDPAEPRWPYLHGLLLLPIDPNAALARLERALMTAPQVQGARWRLAQAQAEHGRGEEAGRHFESVLRAEPDHAPALLGLARWRQSQGRLAEATNLAARCLANPHTARGAHLLMATVLRAAGDAPAAAMFARRFEDLPADAPSPDLWWDEALVYRVDRKSRLEAASGLVDQRRFHEALALLASAAKDYPDDDEIPYLEGWALNQQQQFGPAEAALRRHLQRSASSPKGHAQLAVALLGQRRYEEAIAVLEIGVRLKPTWREFHSNLGFACVHLARFDDAIGHYRNALAQDPNHGPSGTALGELLARRGDLAEARSVLRQTLALNPSDSRARSLLESLE